MFGIGEGELLVIAVVALVVIGPKDLPKVMRTLGNFIGRARGMARHFRAGFDTMIREVELEDMEKKWRAENERIMADHPATPEVGDWGVAPEASPIRRGPPVPRALPSQGEIAASADAPIPPESAE